MSNTGRFHTNEEIALVLSGGWMRVICIDDVFSLFTEHEQAFVRYDLETAWDDSEAFTVEVGVPLKEGHHI